MSRAMILFLLPALMLGGCDSPPQEQQKAAAAKDTCLTETPGIETAPVQIAQPIQKISLTGKVSYNPDQVVRFVPLLAGVVSEVKFSLGDYVRKGQVLLEIRSAELSNLSAELRTAEAALRLAERNLASAQDMHADKLASDRDLVQAESEVETARQGIRKAKEALDLYGGNMERGVLLIRASSNGYIVEKNVVPGQQVEAGADPLYTLSDLRQVWVTANVYAGQLDLIKEGMPVEITTTAYPSTVFHGKINRFSSVFDPQERVLKAQIFLDNPGLLLKPEMFVMVRVKKPGNETTLAVPTRAVVFDNDRYFVVRYGSACDARLIGFSPLFQSADSTYFHGALQPGEPVLTRHSLLVYNRLKAGN
jgi:cobalt-zinc-cadmium efflux system membrane fusion protein